MTGRSLDDLTWTELDTAPDRLLLVPVGSTEQHGPHLPLSTDTDIAVAIAQRLAEVRDDVVVAPPVPYGSSGEHAGFAGTLSIGQEALEHLLVELIRSASASFRGVVLVCGHGGNAEPLLRVQSRMRDECHHVLAFMPSWEGDAHAGRPETAMMLALRPEAVRREAAVVGNREPLADLLPALRSDGVRSVSPSGVLGDPTGADAAEGEALLAAAADQLAAAVGTWQP
ncbi:MAG TPA: mycofactocin biosynthesis peptidyl-dipeptidase MftE [Mycobacteriales bacterium]|nr:mycofactocin biosynthesis peptidyl-dipeptidase MftE [Mycobacteriales bacterium]